MDARAPAVVALVVAHDPGPWFEEALASLRAQDYEELSVLVVTGADDRDGRPGADDVARRVAAELPDAFVRRVEGELHFGAAINDAMTAVEGAAFFLLCHDDVVLAPDAVHLMVEESFRSNAGVITPKVLDWRDDGRLQHVGMGMDRAGAPVERVQPDEVDHGQHDAVRDVFFAPGGATLIRADLLAELGGFDTGIPAMGEDADLGWRAQVAGARVVVAPQARARHLGALRAGLRGLAPDAGRSDGRGPGGARGRAPSLLTLERRHELRTLVKCSSVLRLLFLLPWLLLLTAAEAGVALVSRDRERFHAVVSAWTWNLRRAGQLRRLQAQVRAYRHVRHGAVRRLQVRGSARQALFFSRLLHQGFDVARGHHPSEEEGGLRPELTGTVGRSFSEDDSFDELDDVGNPGRRARRRAELLGNRRSRLLVWLAAAVILVIGTRQLIGGGLPEVGQFVPFPSWTSAWHHLFAGWQSTGVGTTAPATPAYGIVGVLGTVLFGGMGLTQQLLVLLAVPVGAWGLLRFLRPICSPRARLVAGVAYLGLALPYDALAQGRLDGMIAYAAVPWILWRLALATGVAPFAHDVRDTSLPWRRRLVGQIVVLGVIDAVVMSFVPAMALVVVLCAVALAVGALLVGQPMGARRMLVVTAGATVVALVLCLPWVIGVLAAGRGAVSIFGATSGPWSAPSFGALVRFDLGPVGGSPLAWLLPAAAALPLLLGRRDRLAWAARLWVLACGSWVLAWAVGRGDLGTFSPPVVVIVAPAAAAVAAAVGLGAAAFESDVAGFQFGWRQVASALAMLAVVAGVLPVVVEAGDGRWGLPAEGYAQPLSWMPAQSVHGAFRVLWLGDPRAVPGGSWRIQPGLAYSTSEDSTPSGDDVWLPADQGPAADLARDVELAMDGGTAHLGALVAQAGVRYVVVTTNLAPTSVAGGSATTTAFPVPGRTLQALAAQDDLVEVPGGAGYTVFENTAYLPVRAERVATAAAATSASSSSGSSAHASRTPAWRAVLPQASGATRFTGPVGAGTVRAAYAPSGGWSLAVDGRSVARSKGVGWAASFASTASGSGTLSFSGSVLAPLGGVLVIVLWVGAIGALFVGVGRRRETESDASVEAGAETGVAAS